MSINFGDALKAKKIRQYFNEKGRIYIVVDATSDDVMVPDFLKGDPALRLVLNTRMPQPIYIRDSFIESNFSFSGVSHHCVIPMNQIWAAYLPDADMESGMVWDENMPETVKIVLEAADELKDRVEDQIPVESAAEVESTVQKPEKGRKVGHLRVIK